MVQRLRRLVIMTKFMRLLADHVDLAAVAVLVILLGSPVRTRVNMAISNLDHISDQKGIHLVNYENQPGLIIVHD